MMSTDACLLPDKKACTREKDWDNILSAHIGQNGAYTWSGHRNALGDHLLKTTDASPVTSTFVTKCGNFGLIGSSGGVLDMYNMQSGTRRKSIQGGY